MRWRRTPHMANRYDGHTGSCTGVALCSQARFGEPAKDAVPADVGKSGAFGDSNIAQPVQLGTKRRPVDQI